MRIKQLQVTAVNLAFASKRRALRTPKPPSTEVKLAAVASRERQ